MFDAFRQIGLVSDATAFSIQQSSTKRLVLTSVGHSWHAYDCNTLRLVLIGPKFQKRIISLSTSGNLIFAGTKNGIEICRRVNKIGFFRTGDSAVVQMIRIGDTLVSLLDDAFISTWDMSESEERQKSWRLESGFEATYIAHPTTYRDQILIGSESGELQLWNFSKMKKLCTFVGWSSKVLCIEPSPALDVVGIGLASGNAVLFNLKCDEEIHRFRIHESTRPDSCTALAFTTHIGVPLMASGGMQGGIVVWQLQDRELFCSKREAHGAPVASLHFFHSTSLLMSSSEDNSLKQWAVDLQSKELCLIRQRSGPQTPPRFVKFYDQGLRLLTCDQRGSLWCLSTIQDQQNRELSTKNRPILSSAIKSENTSVRLLSLDASISRERDWGHVITAHQGLKSPCLWSLSRYSTEKSIFQSPFQDAKDPICRQPTAVALSQCGSFGLIGYSSGQLLKYNVQSGRFRGEFVRRGTRAHEGGVVGCASDRFNRLAVSAGLEGALRFWSFKDHKLLFRVVLGSPAHHLYLHRGNALCAVATDDLLIRVIDCESRRRVRQFHGHTDRVTSIEMSSDGRWLLTAAMDRTLRIYDIPSATSILVMSFKHPAISFSLSPSMEMLATTHVNRPGVTLWTNQLIFGGNATRHLSQSPQTTAVQEIDQEEKPLTKLAMIPVGSWNVAYGSTLKEQGQALKPSRPAPEAPFFLPPMIRSGAPSELQSETVTDEPPKKKTKTSTDSEPSLFVRHLERFATNGDCPSFCRFLIHQSSVYIEQEILSISREVSEIMKRDASDFDQLVSFLQFLEALIKMRTHFEFSQMLLRLVLRSNMSAILSDQRLGESVERIQHELQKCWEPIAFLMEGSCCMVALFSNIHE